MAVAVAAVASCRRSSDSPGIKKKHSPSYQPEGLLSSVVVFFFVMSAGEVPKIEICSPLRLQFYILCVKGQRSCIMERTHLYEFM